MKKVHLMLVLLFAFAVVTCTSGVASALYPKYVGNTMVDLSWTQYESTDFSKYELYRDGSLIETIRDRTVTFYRDTGLTKGHTYNYEIRSYYTTDKYRSDTTSATTGKVHGTITRDTAWTAASSPHTLTKYDLKVRNGATLTIERGVTVITSGSLSVREKGALYADGVSFSGGNGWYGPDISITNAHASIKNCFFEEGRISLYNSSYNDIMDNSGFNEIMLRRCSSHNNIIGNNIMSNILSASGIELDTSNNNTIIGNNIMSNSSSTGNIELYTSSNNTIKANNCSVISLYLSSDNRFSDNSLSNNNNSGIFLKNSRNNTFKGNTLANNRHFKISLMYHSNNNVIKDNKVLNNTNIYDETSLVELAFSSNNTFKGNIISNNDYCGINYYSVISIVDSSNNNTFKGNTVINNNSSYEALLLVGSSNNKIYNNYFNNTDNAYDDGNNIWNITKTPGTNIVGGPYLGGNYWSDYVGEDLDGDKLGDTLLPYTSSWGIQNGGDYHPLIKSIISVSASPEELPANGTSKSLITAIVANQTGPVVGVDVSFSLDNTSLGTLEPLTAKTNDSGIATSNFTAGTIPGVVNVTANESKTHASDSVKIILGMVEINHTSSTSKFIPTPCRNATINFEIKPALLRDNPETNVSMIIRDKNSKLVYNSSEDQNAQVNKTTAIWTGRNTTGEHVDPRLSNYTVKIIVKYRNMTINDSHEVTVLPNKVIVVVDEERMKALYNDANVSKLMANLTDYCCRNNGTLYNLTKVRHDFNGDPGLRPAFTYRFRHQWRFYPKFVERRLENVTKFMIQNNNVSILLVGNDRVIPFHRETPPKANWEDKYTFIPGNRMWSDYPYSDLEGDGDPDIAVSRLIGNPKIMRSTLENARTKYQSNTVLMACMHSTINLRDKQIGNEFNITWGFNNDSIYRYFEEALDDIADVRIDGQSFLDRLDDGHAIIFLNSHGNDYRDPGENMHEFSDERDFGWFGWCLTFLTAKNVSDIGLGGGHPFVSSEQCHGGVTYPDDDTSHNMPLAFLNRGAVGYVGSTIYSPFGASDDSGYWFYQSCRNKSSVGRAHFDARQSAWGAGGVNYRMFASAWTLYGDPLYEIYVPNDPPAEMGYNISTKTNGENTTLNLSIKSYDASKVYTPQGDRDVVTIPGAYLTIAYADNKPAIPMIIHRITLPQTLDLKEITGVNISGVEIMNNVTLPLGCPSRQDRNCYGGYSGKTLNLTELYPNKSVEYGVLETVGGDKEIFFRIFPLQYDEGANRIYLYKNITFIFRTKPAEPKPPVRLSVTNDFESEITAGASTVVGIFIDNYGTGDAKTVNITEEIPDGFNVTFVSAGGTFNTATNIITWEIQSIGSEDFKMLNYELVAPQTAGNYTINTTIEYTDENGTVYPVINISKSIIITVSGKKTIYVDDDFTDDPANHKWDTIQEGITDATDGDTVLVYNGTYTETVVLNKRLTLTGDGMPTIDAQSLGDAINITADNCTVRGFNCVNAYPFSYVGIRVESNNNVIEENTCKDNDVGIYLSGSSNDIRNNSANYNYYPGIGLWASSENIIANNMAKNNGGNGIFLKDSNNNRITDNDASNNDYDGILLESSNNNAILKTTVNSNNRCAIYLLRSSNNNIYLNNFVDNLYNAYSYNSSNIWHSASEITYTYNSQSHTNFMGNYWSDYNGSDTDGDGIGEDPYSMEGDKDYYPLMERFENLA